MDNNNKTALIICSILGLLIVGGVIMFITWQKNGNKSGKRNDLYLASLNAINTPFDFGTNIYDVMVSGQRNDSTANGGLSTGDLLSMFGGNKEQKK